MVSISLTGLEIEDYQFKSIKKAEPLLTLPNVTPYLNIERAYFLNFFLKMTIKRVYFIG